MRDQSGASTELARPTLRRPVATWLSNPSWDRKPAEDVDAFVARTPPDDGDGAARSHSASVTTRALQGPGVRPRQRTHSDSFPWPRASKMLGSHHPCEPWAGGPRPLASALEVEPGKPTQFKDWANLESSPIASSSRGAAGCLGPHAHLRRAVRILNLVRIGTFGSVLDPPPRRVQCPRHRHRRKRELG